MPHAATVRHYRTKSEVVITLDTNAAVTGGESQLFSSKMHTIVKL